MGTSREAVADPGPQKHIETRATKGPVHVQAQEMTYLSWDPLEALSIGHSLAHPPASALRHSVNLGFSVVKG